MTRLSYMIGTPEVTTTGMAWTGETADILRELADIGYDGVELQTRDPAAFDRSLFRRQVADSGLSITGVSTAPVVATDGLYLTAADPEVRRAAIARMMTILEFAAECGTHASIGRIRGFTRWAPSRDEGMAWLRDAVEQLAKRAEHVGVRIALEPQAQQGTDTWNTMAATLEFVESVGSSALAVEADTFHMLSEERSIPATLVTAHRSGRLLHVQVSDSNRRAPGWGSLNWADVLGTLDALNYHGTVAIEADQRPSSEAVARQAAHFLRLLEVGG